MTIRYDRNAEMRLTPVLAISDDEPASCAICGAIICGLPAYGLTVPYYDDEEGGPRQDPSLIHAYCAVTLVLDWQELPGFFMIDKPPRA